MLRNTHISCLVNTAFIAQAFNLEKKRSTKTFSVTRAWVSVVWNYVPSRIENTCLGVQSNQHTNFMEWLDQDIPTFSMLVSLLTWSLGSYSGAENSSQCFPHGVSEIASVTRPLLVISRRLGVTLGRIFCSNTQPVTPGEEQNYSHHNSAGYTSFISVSETGSTLST